MVYSTILDHIKQDYYRDNYSNEGQRFVAWYLRNIHARDRNQTKDEVTDGQGDKQIDAVVIDDDASVIYIVQGKFIGSDPVDAEPLREVLSSWLQIHDLDSLQQNANERLKSKLAEVAVALEDDYEVIFELITTSTLTPSAQDDLAMFQNQLSKFSQNDDLSATIRVVDSEELKRRYDLAVEAENPKIKHSFTLAEGKHLSMEIAGTKVVIAAIHLAECLKIPGIKDGTLFRKNVRQSLGLNTVNKGIRATLNGEKYKDFFFFHNGITALCDNMTIDGDTLRTDGLNVVNGCQSLNTIYSSSERVKKLDETYIMVRFYEIPQRDRADKISISTNSQSPVKPRDLRSNDKRVLALKKQFEQKYSNGYFITKRGEIPTADKDKKYVLDLSSLGKYLISWHSQRPNVAYSETKIFDKYFEQLFKRDYKSEDAQALNLWMQSIMKCWDASNPIGFNQTLLAMKAYAPYHQLYAVSMSFSITSLESDRVPSPSVCYDLALSNNMTDDIVRMAGIVLNTALQTAANEQQPHERVFSPQNWIKAKSSLTGVNGALRNYLSMIPSFAGPDVGDKYKAALTVPKEHFEYRWQAAD